MKKTAIGPIIMIMVFSFILMSCVHFGNGHTASFEKPIGAFENIHSSGSAELRFHASQDHHVFLTVDSNLEEFIDIRTKNKTLNVGVKNGKSCAFTTFIVDVYAPALSGVSISGSGSFAAIDKIITPSFEAGVSGSGRLEGAIECNKYTARLSGSGKINNTLTCSTLAVNISGSGEIKIAGTGNDSNISISGSGDFSGIEYKTNNAIAHISGSGDLSIWAVESLKANVSGSGSIKYRGNPRIDFSGSGSGRIRSE
jgi:hypothetical protein